MREDGKGKRVVVVGAGPSGVVTAKTLVSRGFEVICLEARQNDSENRRGCLLSRDVTAVNEAPASDGAFGGAFTTKSYDQARLVSSKYITAFSDFRMSGEVERRMMERDTIDNNNEEEEDDDEGPETSVVKKLVCPDHPTISQYKKYLSLYAHHFGIHRLVKWGCRVTRIERRDIMTRSSMPRERYGNGRTRQTPVPKREQARGKGKSPIDCGLHTYRVWFYQQQGSQQPPLSPPPNDHHYNQENTMMMHSYLDCDAVCVCSGLHEYPRIPSLPGISRFRGTVLHSSQYKERSIFRGKKVLVVGCGEAGLDILYRACVPRSSGGEGERKDEKIVVEEEEDARRKRSGVGRATVISTGAAPAAVTAATTATLACRRGFLAVPTEGQGVGVPLDTMITNLYVYCRIERGGGMGGEGCMEGVG